MVYYRKYRPQLISELDLDSVRAKLGSILSSKDLAHAFLFTGPKGLGKTSSARILAKAINCEMRNNELRIKNNGKKEKKEKKDSEKNHNSPASPSEAGRASFVIHNSQSIEPCNECSACVSITNGSNIDVLEIDAASNRGIDEIRELRERIKFAPSSLSKKVYIIDEVHMLTTEAFNALLKTLEEPPSHVVFILATTEFWKLPGTIVSRAFHVQFQKPTSEELIRSLQRIVDGEKLAVEPGVLEKVFGLADGAFRDAAKILEELSIASNGEKITVDLLEKSYKTDSIEREVKHLIVFLSEKNAKESLRILNSLAQNGCDFKIVNEKIVEELRLLLLKKTGITEDGENASPLQISDIETLLEYFNTSYKDIRFSVVPQLPLELAVIKWCIVDKVENGELKDERLEKKNNSGNDGKQISHKEEKKDYSSSGVEKSPPGESSRISSVAQTVNGSEDFLKSLIERIKKENFSVAGILRSFKLVKLGEEEIELSTPYKFHGDKLREGKVQKLLDNCAAEILGRPIKMIITIKT